MTNISPSLSYAPAMSAALFMQASWNHTHIRHSIPYSDIFRPHPGVAQSLEASVNLDIRGDGYLFIMGRVDKAIS